MIEFTMKFIINDPRDKLTQGAAKSMLKIVESELMARSLYGLDSSFTIIEKEGKEERKSL